MFLEKLQIYILHLLGEVLYMTIRTGLLFVLFSLIYFLSDWSVIYERFIYVLKISHFNCNFVYFSLEFHQLKIVQ